MKNSIDIQLQRAWLLDWAQNGTDLIVTALDDGETFEPSQAVICEIIAKKIKPFFLQLELTMVTKEKKECIKVPIVYSGKYYLEYLAEKVPVIESPTERDK